MRHRSLFRPLLQGALALSVAQGAAGAERQAGAFSWQPSLRASGLVTDNVFLSPGGEQSDFGARLQPNLALGLDTEVFQGHVDVGGDFFQYVEHTRASDRFYRMGGEGELGLLPGLSVQVSDAFAPEAVRLGVPDDSPLNLEQSNRAGARIRYWHELGNGRELSLGATGARVDSASFGALLPGPAPGTVVADPSYRASQWEGGGFVEFDQEIGRLSSWYARGEYQQRFFEQSSRSDHGELGLLVGLRTQRVRNLELELAAGFGMLDFRAVSDARRFVGSALLRYHLPAGFEVGLGAVSRFRADLAGNQFLEHSGRFELEKRIGADTTASVALSASHLESETLSLGGDVFGCVEAGLRHRVTEWAEVSLGYRHWRNRGDVGANDLDQNQGLLGFALRY